MAIFYTKAQQDQFAGVVGTRIKEETDAVKMANKIDAVPDRNLLTDAERDKLSGLEGSKFLGTFLTSSAIPTVGAVAGSYADVDSGIDGDVERWVYDATDSKFVRLASNIAGETASSVKTKYESNANTNAFTDAHKIKLDGIIEASDISDAIAALDGALA